VRRVFERTFLALRKRRSFVLVALAALVAALAAKTTALSVNEDIASLLPADDRVIDDHRLVLERFRALDLLFIDVSSERGPRAEIGAAADDLHERIAGSGHFGHVRYRLREEDRAAMLSFLEGMKPLLFTEADRQAVQAKLQPEAVRSGLAEARRTLIEPQGVFMKDAIRRDPLGLRTVFLSKLRALRAGEGELDLTDGRIWSAGGRSLLMVAEARHRVADLKKARELVAFVDGAQREVESAHPGVTVRFAGAHRSTLDNRDLVRADIGRTLSVSLVAIAVLVFLTYRRRWLVVLTLLPAGFGAVVAVAVFAAFAGSVSAVVAGCGAVLIGISVDYAIHVLYRYDMRDETEETAESLAKRLSPLAWPLLMGAGTTAAAFLSLSASVIPGQRELCYFASTGIAAAVLFAVIVLPQCLGLRRRGRRRAIVPLDRVYRAVFAWHGRHKGGLLLLIVAASTACAFGLAQLRFRWGDNLGGTQLVVSGATAEEALARNDRAWELLGRLAAEGTIRAPSSIAPIVPSAGTQNANAARWNGFWCERAAPLRDDVARAGRELGFRPDAFAPFWRDLRSRPGAVTPASLEGDLIGEVVGQRVATADGLTCVLSTFKLADPDDFATVAERVRRELPGAILTNGRAFVERAEALARESLSKLAIISGVVVAAILLVFFGRLELVLAVLVPLGLSLLWTLGTLGLAGVPINMMNAIFVIFIFGMAADYAIFLVQEHLNAYRGERSELASTGGAITVSALTTMAGLGSLVLARHPALFGIGLTALVGMATGLVAAVVVTPLIMQHLLWRDGRDGVPTLRTLAVTAFAYTCFAALLVAVRLVVQPIIFITSPFDRRTRERRLNALARLFFRLLVRAFPYGRRTFLGFDVLRGSDLPAIIVANHQSQADIVFALALPADTRMVVKPWVASVPLFGSAACSAGHIVAKGEGAEALLADAAALLAEGTSIIIFPEGTRLRTGRMRRFHVGAFELAARANADIVPVVLCGTRDLIPNGGFWLGDHNVVVSVMERVRPDGSRPRDLMRRVKSAMREEYERILEVAGRGRGFARTIAARYTYRGAILERYVRWKLRLDPVYGALHGLVPKEGTVLDLGCGHGLAANVLAAQSTRREIIGVDSDERKVRAARGSAVAPDRMRFETVDIMEWSLPGAEAALLIDVLHYWPMETQSRMLARIGAALPVGGRLVVREGCRTGGLGHRMVRLGEILSTAIGHNRAGHGLVFGTERDYIDALRAAGFGRVETVGDLGRGSNTVFLCEKTDV
jgi:1-acyl-sn-glycerol-3-phosphate acyltransferase